MSPHPRPAPDRANDDRGRRISVVTSRAFLALAVALGLAWVATELLLWRQVRAEKIYYNQRVLPGLMREQAQSQAFTRALNDRKAGRMTPLPRVEQSNPEPLNEWLKMRAQGEERYRFLASILEICLFGIVAVGSVTLQIQKSLAQRRWNAPGRPADPEAGRLTAELVERGGCLTSRPTDGGGSYLPTIVVGAGAGLVLAGIGVAGLLPADIFVAMAALVAAAVVALGSLVAVRRARSDREILVDAGKSRVTFRNFRFVTAFVGNRRRACEVLSFADILALKVNEANGHSTVEVRTTRGKVTVPDTMEHFGELMGVLADAVELNRLDPEAYRAALASEPKVRTPWWAWLPVVITAGLVGWWFWWAMLR